MLNVSSMDGNYAPQFMTGLGRLTNREIDTLYTGHSGAITRSVAEIIRLAYAAVKKDDL
jgi:DNA-binding CsgD family transcriptional regulator